MAAHTTELKQGDAIRVGDAVITLIEKRGQRARIRIEAPPEVKISRQPDKATGAGVPHFTNCER